MKTKNLLLLALIATSLSMMGQSLSTKPANAWKTLENKTFAIQYPSNWTLNNSGMMGTSFIIFSQLTSTKDSFRENVNLVIQNLNGQLINLDQYTDISVKQIKQIATNGHLIESKRIKNKEGEYQRMVYTGDQGTFKLKFIQYYWVKNGSAYVLTFTAEVSEFDRFKEEAEKSLNSFTLK